jgi:enoyl-CoA hydratase/carnithine racemase
VTIAAINGYAMGGGLECTLACDIRIAEAQAQMALPECAVGLLPGGSGTQLLPWLVGEGWAKRMILTNERVDAATAERIGLVQQVVAQGEGLAAALAMAERVATLSPRAVSSCKGLIHNARSGVPLAAGLALERERFMDLFDHADQAEGVAAFLEKRKPEWKND